MMVWYKDVVNASVWPIIIVDLTGEAIRFVACERPKKQAFIRFGLTQLINEFLWGDIIPTRRQLIDVCTENKTIPQIYCKNKPVAID